MVSGRFHGCMDDNCTIFKGDVLSSMASFVRPFLGVVHLVEPIRTAGKSTTIKNHTNSKIRVMNVVVEGDTPHHN